MSAARGFTLFEVLVVVFLIALFAAVASPSLLQLTRDVALSRAGMQLAEVYRRSYVESADHTLLLRWNSSTKFPSLEIRKANLDAPANAAASLMSPHGCNAIAWNDPARYDRSTMSAGNENTHDYAQFTFIDPQGAEQALADICYSQHRAYVRYAEGGTFVAMNGVARIRVKNLRTKAVREVLIPSYGLSRVGDRT